MPSEIAETKVNIGYGMEDQYNICYVTAEFIDAVITLDVLMGRNTLPPRLSTLHIRSKEFTRRFDGKKYLITVDGCAEHRHKKFHGKMLGAITDEEWKLNEDDDDETANVLLSELN